MYQEITIIYLSIQFYCGMAYCGRVMPWHDRTDSMA